MASLIIVDGPAKDQKIALAEHRLLMIGRDASASFQIIDPELSRHHLQIKFDEANQQHYAIDFNTKNGVFVNNVRIDAETLLKDGDAIRIGRSTMVYSTDDAKEAGDVHGAWKQFGQGHLDTITQEE